MPIPIAVIEAYGLNDYISIEVIKTGLINQTWKITTSTGAYIIQKVNTNVFSNPKDIAYNIQIVGNYFKKHFPNYTFTTPIINNADETITCVNEQEYYRVFNYISNTKSFDKVENIEQALEAAAQFGKFTTNLSTLDANLLKITIPDFHNLSLRYTQFENALQNGNKERIKNCTSVIKQLEKFSYIVNTYERLITNPDCKLRIMHHDTKISNILFDQNNLGLCVIDLDTIMPGYFFSDIGDMMRTYLCLANEEEKDFSKIEIRKNIYNTIVEAYASQLSLTSFEKENLHHSGSIIIYMQALRFFTDYLNNDIYYGNQYPNHNLNRAKNQLVLLEMYVNL